MRKTVDHILAKNWGRTLRRQSTLRKTGSNLTVQLHETKRIILFFVAIVSAIVFMVGVRAHNKQMYVNNLMGIANTTSGASDEVYLQMYWWTLAAVEEHNSYDVRVAYNRESGAAPAMDYDSEVKEYLVQKVATELETQSMPFSEERAYEAMQDFLKEFSSTSLAIVNLDGISYSEANASADGIVRNAMSVFRKIYKKGQLVNCFEDYPDEGADVAKFVADRICKSRRQYFRWYDLLICFLFAVAVYFVPELIMVLTKKSYQMHDEVIQFESVILVLMYIDRMTVEEILVWMAMFSRVFKKSLQTCICYFPVENEDAIDTLAVNEPFEPFTRLIQNLKVCDRVRVGVEQAFNGLSSERKNYQELRKQENEIAVVKNSARAQSIANSTAMIAIGAYLLVPFVLGAVGEMANSLDALSTITAS